MDRRDERTWVAIELSPQGEQRVEDGTLEGVLRSDLGVDEDFPIFIPASTYSKDGKSITIQLIEGYIFVGSGLAETTYFSLESKSYVHQVMSSHRHMLRAIKTIPHRQVENMMTRLREMVSSDITPNTAVRIIGGKYRNLEGYVKDVTNDQAIVSVELRSLWIITAVPLICLEALGDVVPRNVGVGEEEEQDEEQDPPAKFTARSFHEEVVAVLGELSDYRVGVYCCMEEVMPRVLEKKGLDPDNLPEGWTLRGVDGIYRRVGYAFRNQRGSYCKSPKTVQGKRRGMWGLTEEGVKLALQIKKRG